MRQSWARVLQERISAIPLTRLGDPRTPACSKRPPAAASPRPRPWSNGPDPTHGWKRTQAHQDNKQSSRSPRIALRTSVLVRSDGLLLISRSGVPESPLAHQNAHQDSRFYEGLNIGCVSLEVGIDRAETQGNLKDPRARRTAVAKR